MKTLEELQQIRERMKAQVANRETPGSENIKIVVGMATCGISAGAREVLAAATEEVARKNLSNVRVSQTGCVGFCMVEPIADVYMPDGSKTTYVKMTADKMREVIESHIIKSKPIEKYTLANSGEKHGG